MEMTGAQILMESLAREGVERIFGYAGATICPIADALREDPNIDYTLVRTEQNAGHMASGYARVTGKTGVCIVTSGPGATNLITGVATAYMDSIPLVAITGQVPSNLLGRDIFQEVDITGAVTPFTKHCYLVKDAAQLPGVLKEAFHIASTGRPGPVLIDIPVDVQEQLVPDVVFPEEVRIRGYNPSVRGNDKQIANVAMAIGLAQRPVLCAGGGVFLAHAEEEARRRERAGAGRWREDWRRELRRRLQLQPAGQIRRCVFRRRYQRGLRPLHPVYGPLRPHRRGGGQADGRPRRGRPKQRHRLL